MHRAFAAVFACVSWSLAQEPASGGATSDLRGPAIGEVRDANGKPWLGAEVVLLSRPLPHDANAGEVDRVVAKVGERGRFHASILRGRPYTAWAWGEAGESGRPASAVVDRVFVQQPIVLKQERVLPVRNVVLEHRERWEGFTFRVRIVDETWNREVHWLDVADGSARLPWLVGGAASIELFAVRDGTLQPLSRVPMQATDPAELHLTAPERERITCFVYSSKDNPLADARVFRRIGDAMHFAGATDAAGELMIDAGVDGQPSAIDTFVIGNDGCIGTLMRIALVATLPGAETPRGAKPNDLLCRADRGCTVFARFVGNDGAPLAGLEVWHEGIATNRPTRSSGSHTPWTKCARTDADGRVGLDGSWRANMVNAHVLLRERDYAALPPKWRQGLSPVVFGPLAVATGTGSEADPFVVDLARMCAIEVAFIEASGTPVANVGVVLTTLQAEQGAFWPRRGDSDTIADERGRIRLLVPAAQRLGIAATAGMSMLVRAFETTRGNRDADPATATFTMPPPTGIRGHLFEKNGQPARGRLVQASFGTDNKPAAWDYPTQPATVLAGTKGNALRVLLPESTSEALRLTNLVGWPVAVGADGSFELPLPVVAIPGMLLFQSAIHDGVVFASRTVEWKGESIDDFDWTIHE